MCALYLCVGAEQCIKLGFFMSSIELEFSGWMRTTVVVNDHTTSAF